MSEGKCEPPHKQKQTNPRNNEYIRFMSKVKFLLYIYVCVCVIVFLRVRVFFASFNVKTALNTTAIYHKLFKKIMLYSIK